MIEAYFHKSNTNLGEVDLSVTVWRIMRLERFRALVEHRALWFARFDEMEDKAECRVPEKNLHPTPEAMMEAGIPPLLAHAANMPGVAGAAFFERVRHEKPQNLINCWYLGDELPDEMWSAYGGSPGAVAIRGTALDVGESLRRTGGAECFAYPVTYIDHENDQLPMKHFLGPFFAKMRQFEFESEMRYLLSLKKEAPKGAYVPADLARLVKEVHVNRTGGFDVNVVAELLIAADLNVPIGAVDHPIEQSSSPARD